MCLLFHLDRCAIVIEFTSLYNKHPYANSPNCKDMSSFTHTHTHGIYGGEPVAKSDFLHSFSCSFQHDGLGIDLGWLTLLNAQNEFILAECGQFDENEQLEKDGEKERASANISFHNNSAYAWLSSHSMRF